MRWARRVSPGLRPPWPLRSRALGECCACRGSTARWRRRAARRRGGFIGVSLSTTRAQLIRATFEGVAHNLAWLLRHVEAFIGAPVDEIRLTGGGAQVAGWPQIIADVLNRPVRVVAEPGLAAARSAALRARHLGSGSDEWSPTPAATSASLQPNLEARGVHERQQQAFERAFDALIPVLELLNP